MKEAIKVFNEYFACPECSHGRDLVNEAAIYHLSSFTHREFECKDCRNQFLVPSSIKLNKPQQFKRKPEFKRGE